MDDPEDRVTVKSEVLTVIDSTTALEPVMFSVYPPTEMIASVVRVVSLNAEKVMDGKRKVQIRDKIISFIT